MECPFADESKMVGAAVLVRDVWYWCLSLGKKPNTIVCEQCGWNSDKTNRTFHYDDLDSII